MTGTSTLPEGIAIITGAASGMGKAAATLMAQAGWPLLLCDTNAERLDAAIADLQGGAAALVGDISEATYGERLVEALAGRPVAALIHCAGLSPTMGDPARILEVNLAATMRLIDVVLPRISEGAAVVLFASSAAHQIGSQLDGPIGEVTKPEEVARLAAMCPNSGAAYSISKRGVLLLARSRSKVFGARGGRLVSVSPGVIDTPMGRAEMEDHPIMKAMVENSALARPALAEEVAAVAVFLCSPAASFVTGTDVLVDGGCIANPPPGFA